MSADENKALVRRIFEQGINEGKPEVFDDCIAPGYVNHDMPTPEPGPAGLRVAVQMFASAFPDFHVHLEDVLASGEDKVTTRGRFTGTHQAEFMGVPATGAEVSVDYIDIWRIEGGQAVENWVRLDLLGLMQQLGVMPG